MTKYNIPLIYSFILSFSQQKYTSTEAGLKYRKVNREVRKKTKAAKEEWTQEQCKNIEKGMMSGNSKETCNNLKTLTNTHKHKSAVIVDISEDSLTESTAVLNRWTGYCCGLYNYGLHPDASLLQSNQVPTQEAENLLVLRKEVEEAVGRLKTYSC